MYEDLSLFNGDLVGVGSPPVECPVLAPDGLSDGLIKYHSLRSSVPITAGDYQLQGMLILCRYLSCFVWNETFCSLNESWKSALCNKYFRNCVCASCSIINTVYSRCWNWRRRLDGKENGPY